MPITTPPTGGDSWEDHKRDRQKAKDEAATRRRAEKEKAARHGLVRALCAAALDHANAIDGGGSPPPAGDMADTLIQWRAALNANERVGWADALKRLGASRPQRIILDHIRDASAKTRDATARRLKAELSETEMCWEFWAELSSIGGVFWDWLQEGVPEDGPPSQRGAAEGDPNPELTDNPTLDFCLPREHVVRWKGEQSLRPMLWKVLKFLFQQENKATYEQLGDHVYGKLKTDGSIRNDISVINQTLQDVIFPGNLTISTDRGTSVRTVKIVLEGITK